MLEVKGKIDTYLNCEICTNNNEKLTIRREIMAGEKVVILTKENFEQEVLNSDKVVMVDFWLRGVALQSGKSYN